MFFLLNLIHVTLQCNKTKSMPKTNIKSSSQQWFFKTERDTILFLILSRKIVLLSNIYFPIKIIWNSFKSIFVALWGKFRWMRCREIVFIPNYKHIKTKISEKKIKCLINKFQSGYNYHRITFEGFVMLLQLQQRMYKVKLVMFSVARISPEYTFLKHLKRLFRVLVLSFSSAFVFCYYNKNMSVFSPFRSNYFGWRRAAAYPPSPVIIINFFRKSDLLWYPLSFITISKYLLRSLYCNVRCIIFHSNEFWLH